MARYKGQGPMPSKSVVKANKKKKRKSAIEGVKSKIKGAYLKHKGRRAGKKAAKSLKGYNVGIGVSGETEKTHKKVVKKTERKRKIKSALSKVKLTGRPKTKTYREKNVGVEKTKGGKYPTYKKGGKAAGSFKSEFAKRCVKGATGFTWQGRKYSCAKK